jgi:6-pyruvoyltetrahydropterin/6-carboxytetrahydropterin synthase
MIELTRTVRFSICPHQTAEQASAAPRSNTWSAWPPMIGLGAHYELEVRCAGALDPATGFLEDIGVIDDLVRRLAVPRIHRAFIDTPSLEPGPLLIEILPELAAQSPSPIRSLTWRLSPSYTVTVEADDMSRHLLSQQFNFASSHRLHRPQLSDEKNVEIFGKCNNPNGHGHNYRLEAVVSIGDPGSSGDAGSVFTLTDLERIVDEHVIQRFDHTHLNLDTVEFADRNPTVELIAETCFTLLDGPLSEAGATLSRVIVWETDKTSAICERDPGPGRG